MDKKEEIIKLVDVCKHFKVLNRHEGLIGGIKDLFSKDYKIVKAVDNVSITINQGEIVGFLGPNGAGKSTTIKMMTGVLKPSSGELVVNGRIPYKDRIQNSQDIGVVFGQRSQLWWALPLIESFKILKDIYQIEEGEYNKMLNLYANLVDIDELLHKPVRQMSLGQRTLSDILAAFLHNPKIVFLDEPTIGLDVSMKRKIRELIHELNKQKKTTVILTTHDMGDVDALCQRIVIIDTGKTIYDNNIEQLKSFFGSYRILKIKPLYSLEKVIDSLQNMFAELIEKNTVEDDWISILINEEKIKVIDVFTQIQSNFVIKDMKIEEISTEDVIRRIYEEGV